MTKMAQLLNDPQNADENRLPIIADNDDWDILNGALFEFGMSVDWPKNTNLKLLTKFMRVFFEIVYCMGYRRGKRKAADEKTISGRA